MSLITLVLLAFTTLILGWFGLFVCWFNLDWKFNVKEISFKPEKEMK